ncbi:hypothetical protein FRB90_008548 [Tulasnella sp. 427]|nr:hypothetical protein FRB90_008548 [Tulasnella sp. 427]
MDLSPAPKLPSNQNGPSTDMSDIKHHNSLAPINCLPPELLLDIFVLVIGAWRDYLTYPPDPNAYYAALRSLRLVACGWSLIINNAPIFWIYIDPFAPEVEWRMALERSQDMLLEVDCMSDHRRARDRLPRSFLHQLPRLSQRFGYLNVREIDLEELVNTGAKMTGLASLSVENVHSPRLEEAPWTRYLLSSTPNIRKVTLKNCSFDWPDPGWTNLEALYMEISMSAQSLNLEKILKILSASPGLKDLDLSGCPFASVPAGTQLAVVHLPKLESLSLQLNSTVNTFQLLASIVASPTTQLWLNISKENLSPPQLRNVGRFADRIDLKGSRLAIHHNSVLVGPFGVRIYNREGTAGDVVIEGLRNFLEGLGRSRLKDVEILGMNTVRLDVYPMIHDLCPNLRLLEVGYIKSPISSLLSSARPDCRSEWLFPRASGLRATVHDREDMPEIASIIKARADAYARGAIVEKIRRLEVLIPTTLAHLEDRAKEGLIAEACHWKDEIQNLDPDVVAEFQALSSNDRKVVLA